MSEILFQCVIPGRARILKNGKAIRLNRKTKRPFIGTNDRYQAWALYASCFIARANVLKKPIDFPVRLTCKFYFKDHMHEPDLSNAYQGIEDLLQQLHVLKDDKLIYSHDGSEKIFGEEKERVEITLSRIT
ncbi:RusA family crossover junction endodeoxyribonuclease [Bdellovibrio bacteriovorus]